MCLLITATSHHHRIVTMLQARPFITPNDHWPPHTFRYSTIKLTSGKRETVPWWRLDDSNRTVRDTNRRSRRAAEEEHFIVRRCRYFLIVILFHLTFTSQKNPLKHFKKIFNFSVGQKLFVMVLLGYYHILNIHGPERDLGWGDKGSQASTGILRSHSTALQCGATVLERVE